MRRVGLFLCLIILLASAYLAVVLITAHHQIRGISPTLPTTQALIEATQEGQGPARVRYINTASQGLDAEQTMGHPGFILEWADGRRFLLDTGMEPEEAIAFGKPLEWALGASPSQAFGSVAQQMGEDAESIDAVAFTHLHSDHTQGMISLCKAKRGSLPIFQTPLQIRERNHTTDPGEAHLLSAACGQPTRLEGGPLYPIPGFPGLVAIAAGGHTPGSTIYAAQVGGQLLVFSGDITNSRAELLGNIPKPLVYRLLIVPESPKRLEQLRLWLKQLDQNSNMSVVVSHDLDALQDSVIGPWSK